MRIRKLLLIHPSRSIRALIKKYVYAELSDIEIIEAESGWPALEQMVSDGFDIIVCTDRLKDMGLTELKTNQQTTPANGHTPLIIISESESNHHRNELVAQGFDRVVQIRVRPADLIHKINDVCNPRNWRLDTRYHIPNMDVTIGAHQRKVQAFLINISMGGLLVEMRTDQPDLLLRDGVDITLKIHLADGLNGIEGLKAKLLRLESIKWNPDLTPAVLRATFIFAALEDAQRNKLEALFQLAQADKPLAAEVEK
jgi:CheY-like chemotaxis protein